MTKFGVDKKNWKSKNLCEELYSRMGKKIDIDKRKILNQNLDYQPGKLLGYMKKLLSIKNLKSGNRCAEQVKKVTKKF